MTISATEKTQDAASGAAQPFDAYSGDLAIGNVASSSCCSYHHWPIDFTL